MEYGPHPEPIATIAAAIEAEFELQLWSQAGLRCGKVFKQMYPSYQLRDPINYVTVERFQDTITWKFDKPDDFASQVSSTSREVPVSTRHTIRHNYVAEALTMEDTDVRLQSVFEKLGDSDDNLTPDIYFRSQEGIHHFIELTTTRNLMEYRTNSASKEKLFKYENALLNRATREVVCLSVICVCPNYVMANCNLPQWVVDELISRVKIGIAIEEVGTLIGLDMSPAAGESEIKEMMSTIKSNMTLIEEKYSSGHQTCSITKEFVEHVKGEPNMRVVADCFKESEKASIAEWREFQNSSEKITEFVRDQSSQLRLRTDAKTISVFPLLEGKTSNGSSDIGLKRTISVARSPLEKIWKHAIGESRNTKSFREEGMHLLLKEAKESNPKIVEELENKRKPLRKTYHRIDMKPALTADVRKYLALDGVMGKKFSKDPEKMTKEEFSKMPLSLTTDTSDIDDYLELNTLLQQTTEPRPSSNSNVLLLLEKANQIAENGGHSVSTAERWMSTKLFRSMDIISDIAIELSISFKQNVNNSEFILKKLRHYELYILIKPTNSRSHMFFSILDPNRTNLITGPSSVFRKPIDSKVGHLYPFCSVRADKLENLSTMSASVIAFSSFWSWFYSLEGVGPEQFNSNSSALKMLLLTLLVRLEDKAETEETITQTRYIYMEFFKSRYSTSRPNPYKIIRKLTDHPRSRLNVWCIMNIINNSLAMSEVLPERLNNNITQNLEEGESSLPGDTWEGLINLLGGEPVPNATLAVNLMYIGYVKNKNEVCQKNSEFKLIEKILEEEMTYSVHDPGPSLGEVKGDSRPKKKQFSKECIMFGCKLMESRLRSSMGDNWRESVEESLLMNLSKQLTHELATLKASSLIPVSNKDRERCSPKSDDLHRCKVIEAIASKLGLCGMNPILNLGAFIEMLERGPKGVISDLFKKNQHGGLREIYVLNIESRMVQLFIESISRTLCSYFDEETLTHPTNKMTLIDQHKVRSSRVSVAQDRSHLDICNSTDKTRWNQNFTMPAMAIPLIRLSGPLFQNAIVRILNLWSNKLIKIPNGVCDLLMSNINLSSPVYKELLSQFRGSRPQPGCRKFVPNSLNPFLNTTTGMMQGILHYCSSLLHLSYLHAAKEMILRVYQKSFPDIKMTMTQVCSSDDSASIMSIFFPSHLTSLTKKEISALVYAEVCMINLTKFCNYFCMIDSVKSTIGLYDYIEFNSEFLFRNTLAHPIIKFVSACIGLSESENMVSRFNTQYNLLSELYSSGFPGMNTHICQVAQSLVHYKAMGSSTSPIFGHYTSLLQELPSPTHGFFTLDTKLFPGVMGYSFTYWLAFTNDQALYNYMKSLHQRELESLSDGTVVEKLSIKHGDSRKWHLMLDRITHGRIDIKQPTATKDEASGKTVYKTSLLESRDKELNRDPELLFRNPRNLSEVKTKLLIKASMPGVAGSLGKGNPFLQALESSLYSIGTHCYTKTTTVKDMSSEFPTQSKLTRKTSLYRDLLDSIRISKMNIEEKDLDPVLYFPLHYRFTEALSVVRKYKHLELSPIHRIRHRKNQIFVQTQMVSTPITLSSSLCNLWFGRPTRYGSKTTQRCLEIYRSSYPWIRENFHDTLLASPFSSILELYNFIATQSKKPRIFVRHGPGIYSNTLTGQLSQLARKSYVHGFITVPMGTRVPPRSKSDSMITSLSLAMMIPVVGARNEEVKRILSDLSLSRLSMEKIESLPRRHASAALISKLYSDPTSRDDVLNAIRKMKMGVLISFTKEQTPVWTTGKVGWKGYGECIAISDGLAFRVELKDDTATKVYVQNSSRLRREPGILQAVFNELGCRAEVSNPFWSASHSMKFDGTAVTIGSRPGTPVIEDKNLLVYDLSIPDLQVNITKGMISLKSTIKGREFTILKFRTTARDIDLTPVQGETNNLWDAWIRQRSLSYEAACSVIKGLVKKVNRVDTLKCESDDIRLWVKETLFNRVKFMGAGKMMSDYTESIMTTEDDMPHSHTEEDLNMISELNDELLADLLEGDEFTHMGITMDEKEVSDVIKGNVQDLSSIDPEDLMDNEMVLSILVHCMGEDAVNIPEPVINRKYASYLYLHPMWNKFIEVVKRSDRHFFDNLVHGILSRKMENASKDLMDLLEIRVTGQEKDLFQNYNDLPELQI